MVASCSLFTALSARFLARLCVDFSDISPVKFEVCMHGELLTSLGSAIPNWYTATHTHSVNVFFLVPVVNSLRG